MIMDGEPCNDFSGLKYCNSCRNKFYDYGQEDCPLCGEGFVLKGYDPGVDDIGSYGGVKVPDGTNMVLIIILLVLVVILLVAVFFYLYI
jgi:hypothetical protein